jgi:hypothetical protein
VVGCGNGDSTRQVRMLMRVPELRNKTRSVAFLGVSCLLARLFCLFPNQDFGVALSEGSIERRQRIVARVYGKLTYSSMVYAGAGRACGCREEQAGSVFLFGWLFITLTKTWLGKPCNTCTFAFCSFSQIILQSTDFESIEHEPKPLKTDMTNQTQHIGMRSGWEGKKRMLVYRQ